jgi:cell division protein FtsI/penicillin-binding protein 2
MDQIANRVKILIIFFVIWGGFIFLYLVYFNLVSAGYYYKHTEKILGNVKLLHVPDRSIYDSNVTKVLHDKIFYNIRFREQMGDNEKKRSGELVRKKAPFFKISKSEK